MQLNQKKIVVFGGSSGIGLETARLAIAEGAEVTIVSRSPKKLSTARDQCEADMRILVADVMRESDVARALDAIGPIDHLVYTAGDTVLQKPIDEITADEMLSHFDVRFIGAALVVKYARENMREGGSITLTSSTLPVRPAPGYSIGAGVSGAVNGLARSLALELAPIRVNAVAPGIIRSPLWDRVPAPAREVFFSDFGRRLPAKRVGDTTDVAEAFIYLMKADFTSGQILTVDGGYSVS
jgi:NAD(P)-dependent dehydrogenase (short-subunit alcohol dehydrogenase family)